MNKLEWTDDRVSVVNPAYNEGETQAVKQALSCMATIQFVLSRIIHSLRLIGMPARLNGA